MPVQTTFPVLSQEVRRSRLAMPVSGISRAVLDTDTYNEIDDQFALAWAMLSPEKLDMRAILAAPFDNSRSTGPADGMRKSRDEIVRELDLLGIPAQDFVYSGSERFMTACDDPVDSPAARRIVELAHEAARDGVLLNVIAIAAITDVASALLLDPEIVKFIRVIWLGGHAFYVGENGEFNLRQDVPGAQVLFDSGVPLVLVPCRGVAELLTITLPELDNRLADAGKIGLFLLGRCAEYLHHDPAVQKVIWDIATIAHFVVPEACRSELVIAPRLGNDRTWIPGEAGRHEIRLTTYLDRGKIFDALFARLAAKK